jgi:cytochrome P450
MKLDYDFGDSVVLRSPHALLARLRIEDPVHWNPKLSSWVITSHEHASRVLLGSEISSDRLSPFYKRAAASDRAMLSEVMRYIGLWLVFRDPPEHTRLRRVIGTAINPKIVAGLQPNIVAIVDRLLGNCEPNKKLDFMSDFAVQLPAMVIMDMLGVPHDMLFTVKGWSDDLVNFVGSPRSAENKYEKARAGVLGMAEYLNRLVAARRAEPKNDILTKLIAANDDQSALTDDEVVATAMLMLFGGHETTTNLLGNAVMALHANPDQRERLHHDPGLIDTAVEEFLRFDGPVLSVTRTVNKSHELGGKLLKESDRIFVMIAAANRDPAVFVDPDRLDLGRNPNPHMSFGKGIHFCLGSGLARLEAKIAFNEIFKRYRSIELLRPADELEWVDALVMRGVRRLPISFVK